MAKIEPLNPAELEWITGLTRSLREVGVPDDLGSVSTHFDQQRRDWFALSQDARSDPNPLINAVGAFIGDLLVRECGLEWVLASDEYGTEAAVFGNPGDVLIYPMNMVAKRWQPDGGSLAELVPAVIQGVRDAQRSASS
ncbi:MAG: DUF3806 domain-containing protein [Propionibacteriaceae bacterium]|nr:DUF3806 domain-containing protein [Propionibacteriaceae bacterium]